MKIVFGKVLSASIILNCVYSRNIVKFVILVTRYNSECGLQVFEIHICFYLLVVITFGFRFSWKRQIKQILVEILGSS